MIIDMHQRWILDRGTLYVGTRAVASLVIETTAGTVKVPGSWVALLETSGPWGTPLVVEGASEGFLDPPVDGMDV